MIKIEFPSNDRRVAGIFSAALAAIAALSIEDLKLEAGRISYEVDHDGDADSAVAETSGALAASAGGEYDEKGVPFNATYCGKATEPFYKDGVNKGQWKKRKGVDDKVYNKWYADMLAMAGGQPSAASAPQDNVVNAAAAFGAGTQHRQAQTTAAAPHDTGSLMLWVSTKQAGGYLTQDAVNLAYQQAGVMLALGRPVQPVDLFPPNDDATIAARVSTIYQLLAAKAGA